MGDASQGLNAVELPMDFLRRWILALFLLCLPPELAVAQDIAGAVRAGRWTEAAGLAKQPLTARLVAYYRLLAPGQAGAAEIGAFIAANPTWPWLNQLERRRQEALARETVPEALAAECPRAPLEHLAALQSCADAAARSGQPDAAAAFARRAWTMGDFGEPRAETEFLRRWAHVLRPEDESARFDFLLPDSAMTAARQVARLPAERQALARARLGYRQNAVDQAALLAAVPVEQRDDPALFLAQARALREQEDIDAALVLWRDRGARAQARADAALLDRFWTERHLFSRRRLRVGDVDNAYLLAAGHGALKVDTLVDAQFLAGFIALRFLHDPIRAETHFRALAESSKAAITQGRAYYWLGRTAAAAKSDAAPHYARAAAWPLTFYGQLAASELGEDSAALATRIRGVRDPERPADQIGSSELAQAATILVGWGEPRRALPFLIRLDELTADPADRAALARFALKLGMPEAAVAIARRLGRDGVMLPDAGWPIVVEPPGKPIPVAVGLALIRQESAFEITARSRVGALGLMQLMPATAQAVAKRLGETTSPALLVGDAMHNMRLGTAYLRQMEEQFGALPLAVAAYNAGPHRVNAWITAHGDPRNGAVELLDWIELIPFNETRNYVQRVLENVAIYRARLNATTSLLAEWRK